MQAITERDAAEDEQKTQHVRAKKSPDLALLLPSPSFSSLPPSLTPLPPSVYLSVISIILPPYRQQIQTNTTAKHTSTQTNRESAATTPGNLRAQNLAV